MYLSVLLVALFELPVRGSEDDESFFNAQETDFYEDFAPQIFYSHQNAYVSSYDNAQAINAFAPEESSYFTEYSEYGDNELETMIEDEYFAPNLGQDSQKPTLRLNTIHCEESARRIITSNDVIADDNGYSQSGDLRLSVSRECKQGQLERLYGSKWRATDQFTYQDVEDGIVAYSHFGGNAGQDSCVLQLRNAFASSEHVTLNIIVDFLNTGTPRLTSNSGLLYLEYIDNVPAGIITSSTLKTTDPDTQPEDLIYQVTEKCEFGEIINTELNTRVTSFSQYDVDMGRIRYELTVADSAQHSDEFKFTVTDNKTTLKDNTFVIRFSRLEFEEERITVAETEGEIKVWLSRTGYFNHYAIVTCKSISEIALNQQVQFEPGENRKPCVVPLQQDDRHQGQKQLDLQLAEPSYALLGKRDSMSIVITDPEDKATISFLSDEIHVQEEQRQVVIPVRREGDASKTATVICYTQAASAGDADFERREPRENDQLVFQGTPYNQRDASCTINLIDDSLFEREEFFFVKLDKANIEARIGAIDTVKVVIDGPNDLPQISMAENRLEVRESAKIVSVEIYRAGSDLSQESEVFCNSRAGSASPGEDFEQVHEHVIFAVNQEVASCEVTIFDDSENPVVEGKENFFVYLSGAKGAVLSDLIESEIVIDDEDEDSPTFEFAAPEYAAAETDPVVSVPVIRHGDTSGPASVICRTLQGSAQIDSDFRERINSDVNRIFFEPGETEKNCDVVLIDDEEHEPSETLFLQLKDPQSVSGSPARLGALDETKITLTNTEDTPTITFAKSEVSVREPKPGETKDVTVTVHRYGDTTGNSRVRVSTRDGSAISGVDYEPKSEMLRFRPEKQSLTFTVVVKCNEESAWHKTFSLVMGPDEPVNAVLGEFPAMTVTILDKEASGSLVLPAPPAVISLKDFDAAANADEELLPGYPALCLTPCDPQHPNFDETQSLCEEAGIDNDLIQYSWEVATPDKSNFKRINDATPWTSPKSKVLDSIYFSRKFKIRCRVQAFSPEGKGGTPLRSQPAQVSSEGICHNPLVAGESGFQAQNFQANLKYLDSTHPDHPNSIHITVEVPHEDGLLPLVSTTQINNIDFLLRDRVFRQQHVCSNMLTPEEAPNTEGQRGFLDSYDAARVPAMSGFDRPHQFDTELRSEKTLSLYQYLNLKTCTWTFDSYYTMDELKDICGGRIDKDYELATQDQSHVTVRVPFHVSYIYVQAPTGWAALEHRSEFSVSFYYSNVMWKSGIKTDSELTGDISLTRVSIDANGRLVVELRTRTRFRGLFLESSDKQAGLKKEESTFVAPMGVRSNFTLELIWSQDTFDSPEQHWKAMSKYSRKDYTGEYMLNLIPCTVQPTQGFESGQTPESVCSPHEKAEFSVKIGIQQSARPVPVVYSLNTHFHITNSEQIFLSAPGEYPLEEMDYKGTFSKGSKVFARIMWESQQDLKSAYNLQIEKVYICTGSNGYIPTFDPTGEMYGEGPQYGCIKPIKEISSRFLILDRGNRDAEDLSFQAIPFEAEFADDNEEYKALSSHPSTDGFAFSVDPLYKIIAGHEWYIQVLYEIEGNQGRVRRSAIEPGHHFMSRRAAAPGTARNGTNMGILNIDEPVHSASAGIVAGSIGGLVLFVVAMGAFIFARRGSPSESAYDENSLTPEEVGLLQQKIDYSKLVNQNRVPNNKLKNHLNNMNGLQQQRSQNFVSVKPSRNILSSRDHHVTIHNDLGGASKSGTEI
ncbi:Oidioi.mRNA.OKI2018_I69.XSR.g13247.t3.cds [Oikopleura dioica]|uniref:Oidioi.mRNA.OKI2018_I69.XSR.g13247.t3.cds n=1 Tax=Oikopleura dioica TaxID=34765 RepID=A0ABN7SD97_OIKDI|nr:Oidioi.mRNA.OKI2018_I69.XSR.g13247.t3.cds [Oikopleura dioica]